MGFQITGNCEYSSAGLGSSWYILSITLINKLENTMARTLGPGNQLRNIIQRKQISRAWSIKKNHEPTGRSFALPLRSIQKIIPHLKIYHPWLNERIFVHISWHLTHWCREKWSPFRRRYFQILFLEWKRLNFKQYFIEIWSNWQICHH